MKFEIETKTLEHLLRITSAFSEEGTKHFADGTAGFQ